MIKQSLVMTAIESYLDRGVTDKLEIYDNIIKELNVQRSTVRRIARELRLKYENRLRVLQSKEFHSLDTKGEKC